MLVLAAILALAAAMSIAALRLRFATDKSYGRSYEFITSAVRIYVLLHGLAALLPFLFHQYWPTHWYAFFPASAGATLLVGQTLKLQGFDIPEASDPLTRFRNSLRACIEGSMDDQEYAAMRRFTASFAEMDINEARARAEIYRPIRLQGRRLKAFLEALENSPTTERVLEYYVRFVGKHSFLSVFAKSEEKNVAQLWLFEDRRRKMAIARRQLSAS